MAQMVGLSQLLVEHLHAQRMRSRCVHVDRLWRDGGSIGIVFEVVGRGAIRRVAVVDLLQQGSDSI